MKCPICRSQRLSAEVREENLDVSTCQPCGGLFVQGRDYHEWQQNREGKESSDLNDAITLTSGEQQGARICPCCFRIMSKYKVNDKFEFHLDRCSACGGIWFDKNEWEILSESNLHDELNDIFSASYQRHLRELASRATMESLYIDRFGDADYSEIKRMRLWLETHPLKDELLNYLNDPDPTKA